MYYTAFFTIIPYIVSNIVCFVRMQAWREKDKFISKYIDKYDWFIVLVCVFAGYVISKCTQVCDRIAMRVEYSYRAHPT